jgi:small subunit ribosomal protein S6
VNKLNSYELMVILRPDADEETRAALIQRTREIITNEQGTIGKVDEWGKRRFAYEIDHMTEGYYYVMYFQAEAHTLDEVTRVLKIADTCVRLMPIRLDEPVIKE